MPIDRRSVSKAAALTPPPGAFASLTRGAESDRSSVELIRVAGKATTSVMEHVVMLGGFQEAEVDFVADNPDSTLFHCHQPLHMDFRFMTLFKYA